MKYKKVITVTNAFQKILKEPNRKPNKIRVDKGSEVYNRSMKLFLQNNNKIEMYSTHDEGKSVVAEKLMTSVSNYVYIGKLDEIINTTIHIYLKKIHIIYHDKYITTQEFIKLTAEYFAARLVHGNLASKSGITNLIKKADFGDKLKN